MHPVGAVLAGVVDGDDVVERLSWGNTAARRGRQLWKYGRGLGNGGTHHWLTPRAPSIQDVELKYMPWW